MVPPVRTAAFHIFLFLGGVGTASGQVNSSVIAAACDSDYLKLVNPSYTAIEGCYLKTEYEAQQTPVWMLETGSGTNTTTYAIMGAQVSAEHRGAGAASSVCAHNLLPTLDGKGMSSGCTNSFFK